MTTKRVLVAPLDWGLGHATRCIPLIKALMSKGHEVAIASSGGALILLKKEFRDLTFYELPAYRAKYSNRLPLLIKVLLQLPKFILTISQEHRALEKILDKHSFDLVISDNRYGCWTSRVPCVFITHQIHILMSSGLTALGPVINFFNHKKIKNFTECWIPDFSEDPITGAMTKPALPATKWIGMQSRFQKSKENPPISYKIAAVISGPEPQRTVFEQIVIAELKKTNWKAIVVRGVMETSNTTMEGNLLVVDHLETEPLRYAIESSEVVICRSGYSSVMDLAALEKKALFIPTPGQTEQEYLAIELKKRGVADYQKQNSMDLDLAWKKINQYTGFAGWSQRPNLVNDELVNLLNELLDR